MPVPVYGQHMEAQLHALCEGLLRCALYLLKLVAVQKGSVVRTLVHRHTSSGSAACACSTSDTLSGTTKGYG